VCIVLYQQCQKTNTLNKFQNLFVLFLGLRFFNQVDLVLQDDYMLKLHNFDGCQVLRRLRLRAWFIASYNKIAYYFQKRRSKQISYQHQKMYRLPIKSNAASITAAPLSIVAIRISCPGQSTKETCRTNWNLPEQTGRMQGKESSLLDPPDMKRPGRGHFGFSHS